MSLINYFRSRKNLLKRINNLEKELNSRFIINFLGNSFFVKSYEEAQIIRSILEQRHENDKQSHALIKKQDELRAREIALLTLETVNKNTAGRSDL